jgi:hypothetical protein
MDQSELNVMYAYHLGYRQGRDVGVYEHEAYELMEDYEQHAYRKGYDHGVSDYCTEELDGVDN